ncbi:hypothetical protein [Georgenia sp. SUBG003]|uniref:hypothetical protein n=1 Tax=Georgenia sp. SUBG003 TaxID=1497974 RepID=UPI003AB5E752
MPTTAALPCSSPVAAAALAPARALPRPHRAAGRALDAALHDAALEALRNTSLLPEVGTDELRKARAAQALLGPPGQDENLLAALAPMVGGLVHVPPEHTAAARVLGVVLRDLSDVVDDLPAGGHEPRRWRDLYAALAPYATAQREALTGLPVPLHDGRTARGAAGCCCRRRSSPPWASACRGLRVVHPRGRPPPCSPPSARPRRTRSPLLEQPEVRAAVEAGTDALGDFRPGDGRGPDDGGARGVVGVTDMEWAHNELEWPGRVAAGLDLLRVRTATYADHLDAVLAAGLRTGDPLAAAAAC